MYRESALKGDKIFPKMTKNLYMPFAAVAHLAEGLFSCAATLKVDSPLICILGTRIPTVSVMEWKFVLHLKPSIRNKASKCCRLE
jgi:hypothetical protein